MANTRKISDEQIRKILSLWGEGYTREELAERFGVSAGCIAYYVTRKNEGEKAVSGYIHRKYQLLNSEEYDKARIFYHINEGGKYINKLVKRVKKRFPELSYELNTREDKCSKLLEKAKKNLNELLELDWKAIEKECKEKWRAYEKECRKRTGRSSMDRLYRVKENKNG